MIYIYLADPNNDIHLYKCITECEQILNLENLTQKSHEVLANTGIFYDTGSKFDITVNEKVPLRMRYSVGPSGGPFLQCHFGFCLLVRTSTPHHSLPASALAVPSAWGGFFQWTIASLQLCHQSIEVSTWGEGSWCSRDQSVRCRLLGWHPCQLLRSSRILPEVSISQNTSQICLDFLKSEAVVIA